MSIAFFDIDGTLVPKPSLELRFLGDLLQRRKIPPGNYLRWAARMLRSDGSGFRARALANKMYLRGVENLDERSTGNPIDSTVRESGHQDEGQASKPPRHNPRSPVPRFFEDGVERVTCHAMLGHTVVIVSGTLEPLAKTAARALEAEIAARGFARSIRACATRLKEMNGRWTGEILGEPIVGEAKARVLGALAREMHLDLSQCWAYGDSAEDRWMLAEVGSPVVMNPTFELRRIARKRGWPIWRTTDRVHMTQNLLPQAERCA